MGRFEGFVARYIGDGVLAYFGYPHAQEHDAERAIRAGLELVDEVPKLKSAAGARRDRYRACRGRRPRRRWICPKA